METRIPGLFCLSNVSTFYGDFQLYVIMLPAGVLVNLISLNYFKALRTLSNSFSSILPLLKVGFRGFLRIITLFSLFCNSGITLNQIRLDLIKIISFPRSSRNYFIISKVFSCEGNLSPKYL